MALSDRAAAMYKDWYPWVADAVKDTLTSGKPKYSVAELSAAASEEAQRRQLGKGGYDPIGVSGLYGAVNRNFQAAYRLSQAPDTALLTGNLIGDDLFGRPAAEQEASPMLRAVVTATYVDQFGQIQQDTFTQFYKGRLPPTVGSLRAHVELDVQDMLSTPPPVGTPRQGQLVSIDLIQLTAA